MTGLNPTRSIITLNINGINSLIKRKGLSDWGKKKKQDTTICSIVCLQEMYLKQKHGMKLKESPVNDKHRKAGVTLSISEMTVFKIKCNN